MGCREHAFSRKEEKGGPASARAQPERQPFQPPATDRLTVQGTAGDDATSLVPRRNADGRKAVLLTRGETALEFVGGEACTTGADTLDGGLGTDVAVNGETLINIPWRACWGG